MKRAVIRLPSEVVDRLDRLAEELRLAHPEERYSRASVVRALISSGLRTMGGAQGPPQPPLIDLARSGSTGEGGSTPEVSG